jgi:hypothetical protein
MRKVINFLTLFTSFSTLICCALPALIVTLGFGAAMAGFLGDNPQFIFISENKSVVFIIGAILLTLGGYLQYRARFEPCPLDPKLAKACTSSRIFSLRLYLFSVGIYFIGLLFAYILPSLLF